MKFFKRLFKAIVTIIILFVAFIYFKPQIDSFLIDKGLKTSSTIVPMPVSESFTNDLGESMYLIKIPALYSNWIQDDTLYEFLQVNNGYVQVHHNNDGSIDLVMQQELRDVVLLNASEVCDDRILSGFLTDNISSIDHNSDYSVFYVVADEETSETELISISGKLFVIGEVYSSIDDSSNESNCRIEVYSSSTGDLINSFNSDNLAGDITGDALEHIGDSISDRFNELANRFSSN